MIVGRTPWETEQETRSHGEHWLDYYRQASAATIGRTPDRTIIEEQLDAWPHSNNLFRLRMEWDASRGLDTEYMRQVQRVEQHDVFMSCGHVYHLEYSSTPNTGEWLTCWMCVEAVRKE